jgi:hypothetical protein
MPVIFTALVRVRDWQALQAQNNDIVTRVQAIKATRYQIYRNSNDASLALVLIELPDPDDAGEMRQILVEQLNSLPQVNLTDDRIWEPTDCQTIGFDRKEAEL